MWTQIFGVYFTRSRPLCRRLKWFNDKIYGSQYSPGVISQATEQHTQKRVKKKFISHNFWWVSLETDPACRNAEVWRQEALKEAFPLHNRKPEDCNWPFTRILKLRSSFTYPLECYIQPSQKAGNRAYLKHANPSSWNITDEFSIRLEA